MPRLTLQLFGGFYAALDDREIKAAYAERLVLLLGYLALHTETPIPRRQLAYTFWPDSNEEQARTNLRNLVHLLRRAVPLIDEFLDIDNQFISWKKHTAIQIDALEFRHELVAGNLSRAIDLYHGEILPGYYQEWVLLKREELHQFFIKALMALVQQLEANRQYAEAIQAASRLLRADPLNEWAYEQSMRLHALNNDRGGALKVYHTCSATLQQELGVAPSHAVTALYSQLIHADELSPTSHTTEDVASTKRMIGRNGEWATLKASWLAASRGNPTLVLILGEAGIGKTRLAGELAMWAKRQGIITASAQSYAAEGGLPFAPVIAWLREAEIRAGLADLDPLWQRELIRLIPEQETGSTPGLEGDNQRWQKHRLFEAVARAVIPRGAPRLLWLDDIQWSDPETLELIHYLLRYQPDAPLLVMATVRIEALDTNHPLNLLREALRARNALIEIELSPLNNDEIGQLARDLTGEDLGETQTTRIFQETEGNPFFAIEMLRSGQREKLPGTLRAVLNQRLGQLTAPARELAGLAATIGREFELPFIMDACKMDENAMVQALDELWMRRIIHVQPNGMYDFTHGKLQEAAYEGLSAIKRQFFHRRIAETGLSRSGLAEPARLAWHLEQAGDRAGAAEQYLLAAGAAIRVFANREAITHLEKALVLMGDSRPAPVRAAYEQLGDLHQVSMSHKAALTAYDRALGMVAPDEGILMARLTGKRAKSLVFGGDYAAGQQQFQHAQAILQAAPAETDVEWRQVWLKIMFDLVWGHYEFSNIEGMQSALEQIAPLLERFNEKERLGEYYYILPAVYFRRNGYQMTDDLMRYSSLALEYGRHASNLEFRTRAHFGYGFCNYLVANFDLAMDYLEQGLKLADQFGLVEQQIYCLTYLSATERGRENLAGCREYAERALALCLREDEKSFAATARANLGWIAWKQGQVRDARSLCELAVTGWGQFYPFKWYGLWVLIEICLVSGDNTKALEYARMLKTPGQQVFRDEIDGYLTRAIEATKEEDAKSSLARAVDEARKHHYL